MDGTCSVRLTRYYGASPGEVWAALTDPASSARWLGPMADALPASVRSQEAERVLELDWAPPGEQPSVVRFELYPNGEGTALVLDHRRIDATRGMRAMWIWEGHLARLDALLAAAEGE